MNNLEIVNLAVHTLGISVFGSKTAQWFRDSNRDPGVVGLIVSTCFVWFLLAFSIDVGRWIEGFPYLPILSVQLIFVFFFPPMIMHLTYIDRLPYRPEALQSPLWKITYRAFYVSALVVGPALVLSFYQAIDWAPMLELRRWTSVLIGVSFMATGIYAVSAMRRTRNEAIPKSNKGRGEQFLYGVLIFFALLMFVGGQFGKVLETIGSAMPLLFIFVGTWDDNRFEFVDQLVKRVVAVVVTFATLFVFFSYVWPWASSLPIRERHAWVYAALAVPFVFGLPWLIGQVNRWIERRWFGRRLSAVEAVRNFLSAGGSATTEAELLDASEQSLSSVFDATVTIELGPSNSSSRSDRRSVQIQLEGERIGQLQLGQRRNDLPYFAADLELARSLGEVFAALLENIRLQQRKRELSLSASTAELKALRAQINPHFLFNALNSIAGLIHQEPQRADRTIEQLAEVFRYTLRGSSREWASLQDELDFATAYLDVEQARFGKRLQVRIDVDATLLEIDVPTMLLQTLVENAIKHGIAQNRQPGEVAIEARRVGDQLELIVRNDGPPPRTMQTARGERFGLAHIRQRLEHAFGDEQTLTLEHDATQRHTTATIRFPISSRRS